MEYIIVKLRLYKIVGLLNSMILIYILKLIPLVCVSAHDINLIIYITGIRSHVATFTIISAI